MEKEIFEQDEKYDGVWLSCDPTKFDCKDCVFAFVHGLRPTCNYCGKYARKPKHVYFGNQPCHYKQPFQKVNQPVDKNTNNDTILEQREDGREA